jgi:hypothetical protein
MKVSCKNLDDVINININGECNLVVKNYRSVLLNLSKETLKYEPRIPIYNQDRQNDFCISLQFTPVDNSLYALTEIDVLEVFYLIIAAGDIKQYWWGDVSNTCVANKALVLIQELVIWCKDNNQALYGVNILLKLESRVRYSIVKVSARNALEELYVFIRRNKCARFIQNYIKKAISNPYTIIGRKRLLREYNQLCEEGSVEGSVEGSAPRDGPIIP